MRAFACLLSLCAIPAFAAPAADEFKTSAGAVKLQPLQHASLLLQGGGKTIYIDPTSQAIAEGLPQADLVLITHIHGDHFDPKALAKVRKSGAPVYGPPSVVEKLPEAQAIEAGQSKTFGGWKIEAIPAYNMKRGPSAGTFFHPKGRDVGYVLTFGGERFYIAGDTEAIPEMKGLKGIKAAFIPMNLPYTMTPEEAAEGVRTFKPEVVYPYHHRGSDLAAFRKALEGSGVEVRVKNWY